MEPRKTQNCTKSKIAIKKGSTIQNKENIPNNTSKKLGVGKKALKPPSGRNTLTSRKDNNAQEKPGIRSKRPKDAPDFSKLHKKWETKLAKIEPFNLTKEVNTKPEETDPNEDLSDVEVDEPVEMLHEESEIVEKITDTCCSCGKENSQRKQVPSTPTIHFKVPKLVRKPNPSSAKTKEKRVQFVDDPFEFKPDNNALQSILNNDGIRSTPSKRNTGVYCSSPFNQKRTSIYYTGPRPDRPLTAFEKRLSMRRAAAIMTKMRQPESHNFEPSQTLVGVQEIGNKFTAVTSPEDSGNDSETNAKCIPEETSEDTRTRNNDTIAFATGSPHHEVEDEISWADTLKCYSQSEHESYSPVEDAEALIAQLEEEVRQTLSDTTLTEKTIPSGENPFLSYPASASKVETEIVSIPLQQRRQKPSIYRKLFASPCNVQTGFEITDRNVPQYSHTAAPSNVKRLHGTYPKEVGSTQMPESVGFSRLPIDIPTHSLPTETNYTAERRTGIPLEKRVPFSPFVSGENPECNIGQAHGRQNTSEIGASFVSNGKEMSTCLNEQYLKTFKSVNNCFENPENDAFKHDDSALNGKFDRKPIQGIQNENLSSGNTCVAGPAFTTKYSSVQRNALQGFGCATLGSLGILASPGSKAKENADYLSLVTAANASLSAKLKKRGLGTGSTFRRMDASSVQTTKHSTNSYTSNNEQKILVPTPIKPVVSRDELLYQQTGSSQFISRHRQIMRDAMVKSQEHAHDVLLDAEVSLYARNIDYLRKYGDLGLRLVNPLAKLMSEGDDMHFVPVLT